MSQRHILIVTRAGVGGAALHVEEMARRLDRARFKLEIIASPLEDPAFIDRLRALGIKTHALPIAREFAPLADLRAFLAIGWRIFVSSPDTVHAHTTKPGVLARLAALVCGVPVVVYTPHGFYHTYDLPPRRRAFYRALERVLGRATDTIVAVNSSEASEAERCAPGRATRLANAIAIAPPVTEIERASIRRELGVADDAFACALVGRLSEPKTPEVAVQAVMSLARPATLVIVGGGVGEGALTEAIGRGRGGARTIMAGARPDGARVQAACDVALLSSRSEGMPYTLLEAAAAGVPAVASDLPGCREVIVEGATGFLFEVDSVAAMARAIDELQADPARRLQMGEAARRHVAEHFDPERWARALEKILEGKRR